MTKLKFFVYGTLKLGGYFSKKFDSKRTSTIKATAMGTMFNINNAYPAVIFDGKNKVLGEIHEYNNEQEVLAKFDFIEGYDGEKNPNNLYNRKNIKVITEDGNKINCVTYEFNKKIPDFKKVKSGFWEI